MLNRTGGLTRKTPLKRSPMRRKGIKSTQTSKAAHGKPCMIRLPGCDGGGETTVLAHYRLSGYSGTGLKPPDSMAAYACFRCHAIVDGRLPRPEGYSFDAVRLAHAEGVMRTQQLKEELA